MRERRLAPALFGLGLSALFATGVGAQGVAVTATLSAPHNDLTEGEAKTAVLGLDRALVMGESLSAPLTFSGTATRGADYTLACANAANVTCSNLNSGSASIAFAGPSAPSVTITLTAVSDRKPERAPETVSIGLGTLTTTGLSGATANDYLQDFDIVDAPGVGVAPTTLSLVEDYPAKTYTLALLTDPGANVTVTAASGDGAVQIRPEDDGDFGSSATFTFTHGGTGNWSTPQTVEARATPSDGDTTDESTRITHQAAVSDTTNPYHGLAIAPVAVSVTDSSGLPTVAWSPDEYFIDEGAGTVEVAVKKTGAAAAEVAFATLNRTATAGSDYTAVSGTVAWTAGDTANKTITVPITDDNAKERSESFFVVLSVAPATTRPAVIDGHYAQVIIWDNDPIVTIAPGASPVTEGAAGSFTVSVDTTPTSNLSVNLVVTDTPAGDFVAADDEGGQTVTIDANTRSAAFTVRTTADTVDEPSGPLTVAVASGTGYTAGDPASASVTVSDNDPTTVTLSGPTGGLAEGSARDVTLALGRALVAGESLSVPLTFSGTATRGTDYTLACASAAGVACSNLNSGNASVDFRGPSAAAATLTMTAVADSAVESPPETVGLGLGTPTTAGLDGVTATDNLADFNIEAKTEPVITIVAGANVTEGTDAAYTLKVDPVPNANLTVNLSVADAPGADFVDAADHGSDTVTINAGAATAAYTVDTTADGIDEPSGPVTVTVASGTGYTAGDPSEAAVTVSDNDATTVTLAGGTGNLNEGKTRAITLTLGRALVAGEKLSAPFTFSGTATRGADYSLACASAAGVACSNLNSGAASAAFTGPSAAAVDITLTATADNRSESTPETVAIGLGALTTTGLDGAAADDDLGVFSIQDAGRVTVKPTSLSVTEGESARTYTLALGSDPGANVTVTATSNDGAVQVRPLNTGSFASSATFTFTPGATGNWNTAQSVEARATPNDGDSVHESARIDHAATVTDTDNPFHDIRIDPVAVSVVDATGTPRVAYSPDTYTVDEGDGTVEITVTKTGLPAAEVAYSTLNRTASAGSDYTRVTGTLTWAANDRTNRTISVPILVDEAEEQRERFFVVLSSPAGTTRPTNIDGHYADVLILDNSPTLTIAPGPSPVTEGTAASFTVTASAAAPSDLLVELRAADATGSDFLAADDEGDQTAILAGGDRSFTYTVNTTADNSAEPSGPVTLALVDRAGYSVGSPSSASVIVADDDDTTAGANLSPASLALTEGHAAEAKKAYSVVLATDPGNGVTVTVTPASADSGAATTSPASLAFTGGASGTWSTPQSVTVIAVEDGDVDDESFNITHALSAPSGNDYDGVAVGAVAVAVADAGHGVIVAPTMLSVRENDGTAVYSIRLKSAPGGKVTVTPTSGDASKATVAGAVSFSDSDWRTPRNVTVTGKGSASETVTIGHAVTAATTDYPTGTPVAGVAVTLTADVTPEVTVAPDSGFLTVKEGELVDGSQKPVRFRVAAATDTDLQVAYTVSQEGSFLASTPGAATAALEASSDFFLESRQVANDSVDEPNGSVSLTLAAGSGYLLGSPASATITLIDDDPTSVTLARTGSGAIAESGGTATLTVTLGRNLVAGETVTAPLAISGSGVTAGDYGLARSTGTNLNTGVTLNTDAPHSAAQPAVVFAGHDTNTVQVATLTLTATDDSNDEGTSETLNVGFGWNSRAVTSNLDRATGAGTEGTSHSGTVSVEITDDDDPTDDPVVTISADASPVTEGANASYTVTATPAPSADLTVNLTVADAPNSDFVATGDEGDRPTTIDTTGSATFTVATAGDSEDEPDGPVTVTVQSGSGYTVGTSSSATVTVEDGSPTAVTLDVLDATATEGDANDTARIRLGLSRRLRAGESLIVPLQFSGGAVGTDFALSLLANPVGATLDPATGAVKVTGPTSPGESAMNVNVLLTAAQDDDTVAETVTVNIPVSSSTGTLRLTAAGLGGGATGSRRGTGEIILAEDDEPPDNDTVPDEDPTDDEDTTNDEDTTDDDTTDDDTTPVASFAAATSSADESAGMHSVTVSLSPAPRSAIHLTYTVNGSATAGADFTPLTGSLAVISGATSVDLPVELTDDADDEDDETVTLALESGDGYALAAATVHTLTIVDNDTAISPVITIAPGASPVTEGANAAYTITADPAPAADLTVNLAVTDAPHGDFVAVADEGERTATIGAEETVTTWTVATSADGNDEPNGLVTVTVTNGAGYTVGSRPSAAVGVNDDDATSVTLARSGSGTIAEDGGTATLTVTLGRSLRAGETVTAPLAIGGAGVTADDYGLALANGAGLNAGVSLNATPPHGAAEPAVVFTGRDADPVRIATLTLTATDDSADEGAAETLTARFGSGSRAVTSNLDRGSGGTSPTGEVTVEITDDDDRIVAIAGGDAIEEGGEAVFTLTATPPAAQALEVTVTLSQTGDYADPARLGESTVTIPGGSGVATAVVATLDDAEDEADGAITAALRAGARYRLHATDTSASVPVHDNDVYPALSIADAEGFEGATLAFRVTLDRPAAREIRVSWRATSGTASSGADFAASAGRLAFAPGETEKTIDVPTVNDAENDPDETFALILSEPEGATIADGEATGTIRQREELPVAWLGRFGRAVAQQALDNVAARIADPRRPGRERTVAGQPLAEPFGAPEGHEGAADTSGQPTARGAPGNPAPCIGPCPAFLDGAAGRHPPRGSSETGLRNALLATSFTTTGKENDRGGSLAFWGRGAHSTFDGEAGGFGLGGEVSTVLLGGDYARDDWLLGLAVTQSLAEGDHGRIHQGGIESTLTAALPYAALKVGEHLSVWAAAGHGAGEARLGPNGEPRPPLIANLNWRMASVGARSEVAAIFGGRGPALALVTDALWTETTADGTSEMAASRAAVTRLRLGIESRWLMSLDGAGQLAPTLEIGARHDGGDAETGFGVELGGGLAWRHPTLGLGLDLSARTLIAHRDEAIRERGFSADIVFDPDPETELGPSLRLRHDLGGPASGGVDALFAAGPFGAPVGVATPSGRWTTEAAWGLRAFRRRFSSGPRLNHAIRGGDRDFGVGWRIVSMASPDEATLSFDVGALRREGPHTEPEHAMLLEIGARW